PEARVVRSDAHVAADRDADAAADTVAVDHREKRLGQRAERALTFSRDPAIFFLIGHVAPPLLELRDVGTGYEGLIAGAAQDDDTDRVVGGEIANVVGHQLPHLEAHRVSLIWLVEQYQTLRSYLFQQR